MVNTVTNHLNPTAMAATQAPSSRGTANTNNASPAAGPGPEQQVSKDLFLKLMVAQLQNQNPLNPVDGVDFLMQLSQISSVEQMVEMRQQLEAIHLILDRQQAPPPAAVGSTNQ